MAHSPNPIAKMKGEPQSPGSSEFSANDGDGLAAYYEWRIDVAGVWHCAAEKLDGWNLVPPER